MEFAVDRDTAGSLGELLRDIRNARHLTQAMVASTAGVARTTLNRWEQGVNHPRLPELTAVLEALGASPEQHTQALALIPAPRAKKTLQTTVKTVDTNDKDIGLAGLADNRESWLLTPETGDLLRAMRLRSGQSQEQVASQVGVRRHILSRWENGDEFPSAERLNLLAKVLRAFPEEQAALSAGRLLTSHTSESEISLEQIEAQLWEIMYGSYQPDTDALKDLEFLRLERRLNPFVSRLPAARHLLLEIYSQHSQWLVNNRRFAEGMRYADRVIEAVQEFRHENIPTHRWQRAVITSACCVAYGGKEPQPARGAEILEDWLPSMDDPAYQAWTLGLLAQMTSEVGNLGQGLDLAIRSCRVAQRSENPSELRHRRVDRASILLKTGKASDAHLALDLIPANPANNPSQRLKETTLLARALIHAGEKSEAHDWLGRATEIADTYHLNSLQVKELVKMF